MSGPGGGEAAVSAGSAHGDRLDSEEFRGFPCCDQLSGLWLVDGESCSGIATGALGESPLCGEVLDGEELGVHLRVVEVAQAQCPAGGFVEERQDAGTDPRSVGHSLTPPATTFIT
ncbi:hypothetical protein [Actinomadura physcomitrii]|uniref:hypothetical protein n=1 Tax=Actinomadura physcomitrii TaxID=2650748 RepID=UPI001F1A8EB5|nr:hypothetical protein [Actinomadura physcomitrii]